MDQLVRTLVVDDSAFARTVIVKRLGADSGIEVVGIAKDGEEAIAKVKELKPDVVTMDVTMPGMDGLTALRQIMADCPTPVVMLSALTSENAPATLEALELGAVDFFLKPSSVTPAGVSKEIARLIEKVRAASAVDMKKVRRLPAAQTNGSAPNSAKKQRPSKIDKVLVIGSSTGGPRALAELIPEIPPDLPAAILIVQHMPSGFTFSLADRLNRSSQITVKEAEEGDRLANGVALLAPGGYHMVVNRDGKISLNQDPQVWGVRPSVDVTMQSVAPIYGSSCMGVVLTGMGSDGSKGSAMFKKMGGKVAVEHESTCAIYGMPRTIVEEGNADKAVPLTQMAREIVRMCGPA